MMRRTLESAKVRALSGLHAPVIQFYPELKTDLGVTPVAMLSFANRTFAPSSTLLES